MIDWKILSNSNREIHYTTNPWRLLDAKFADVDKAWIIEEERFPCIHKFFFFFYFSWQLYGNLWLIFWLILQLVFSVRLTNDWTLRPFQSSFFQFNTVKKENGENKKKFIIPMTLTYIIFKEFFGLCCFLSLLC